MRPLHFAAVAALVLAAGACGGGGGDADQEAPTATATAEPADGEEPTQPAATEPSEPSPGLEAYYQELDAAENAFRQEQDAAQERFNLITETTPVEDVADILLDLRSAIDRFVADLEAIDPPAATEAPHAETIAGFQFVSGLIEDAVAAADSGATVEEVFAFFETAEATEASDALDATCDALQAIADQNGIVVDLSCED
jgi:hypothetical protein